MANSSATTSGGIGFCGVLFIVFLILKLTNYIDWSWWLITLPLLWWLYLIIIGIIVFSVFWILSIIYRSLKKIIN
jgi:hypothetical protein